jgi:hypothetical protein
MRLAITTLLALILFAAGAAGTYFLMPAIAPENVIVARRYQDSIRAVMDSANAPIRTAALIPDTLRPSLADTLTSQPGETIETQSPASPDAEPEAEAADAERLAEQQAQTERARELAGVLVKLEDSELRAIIAHLDPDVLQSVYQQASARGKTKLLQSIPPEKAALFVRALVRPTERPNG